MSTNRMSTSEIKKGLQSIKQAQLEVLRELRGQDTGSKPAFAHQSNNQNRQINSNIRYGNTWENQINSPAKIYNSSRNKKTTNTHSVSSHSQSIRKSTELGNTRAEIENVRKEVKLEKDELNEKISAVNIKLRDLQRKNKQLYSQKQLERQQIRILERQKIKLQEQVISLQQKLFDQEHISRKLKLELQMKESNDKAQLDALRTQLKTIQNERTALKQQLSQKQKINAKQQHQKEQQIGVRYDQDQGFIKLNQIEKMITEVKRISNLHDIVYEKLKVSGSIQLAQLDAQQGLQIGINRLLYYLESSQQIQNSHSPGKQSRFMLQMEQQWIDQEQDSVAVDFIQRRRKGRERGSSKNKYQEKSNLNESVGLIVEELRKENSALKTELQNIKAQSEDKDKEYAEISRMLSLEMQNMRIELEKLKRHRQGLKQEQLSLEEQSSRHRQRAKQLQARSQQQQQRIQAMTSEKYSLQKRIQQQDISIADLNAVIRKVTSNREQDETSGTSTVNTLRTELNRLLQSNGVILREKESLRAMNEGLQVQIQTLKFQKEQHQANGKQKHELIERQIRERTHLMEQLQRKQAKCKQYQNQMQKTKDTVDSIEQQSNRRVKVLEDSLQDKAEEVLLLRKEIDGLFRQSRDHHALKFRHQQLQIEYKQLKRKSLQMSESLSHLWSIKQVEYQNVNQIIGLLKSNNGNGNDKNKMHFAD